MIICDLNLSALHHPLLESGSRLGCLKWRPYGLACGCICMCLLVKDTGIVILGGGGCKVGWDCSCAFLSVILCDVSRFSVYLCMCTSMVILLYFPRWCPQLGNLSLPITPTTNMFRDEIIEWDSAIMSTVHMPDIKSHHFEDEVGSLVGPWRA